MNDKRKLCRVCLSENADIAIFGKNEESSKVCSKLSYCLHEKVEDIAGYPKNICKTCNNLIDSVLEFAQKYKESCQMLAESCTIIKKEQINDDSLYDTFEDNTFIDCDERIIEPEFNDDKIKIEVDIKDEVIELNDDEEENLKLSDLAFRKQSNKKGKQKSKHTRGNNKIASAILEGDFTWLEDKCAKLIGNTVIRQIKGSANESIIETKPCKRPCKQEESMIKKLQTEKKPEESPLKLCDSCGQVFDSLEKLSTHRRHNHSKKEPADCPKCNKKCASKYNLSKHIKRCHSEKKDFICSSCGKGFAFRTEMVQHYKKTHEKHRFPKKKFWCKFCDKTYSCAKSVLIHERSVHTGERPAVCTVCDGRFYCEEYLREHMRLHTGDTPFKCPLCGRGYAQRGNMKSHVQHNHRLCDVDPETLAKLRPSILRLLKT